MILLRIIFLYYANFLSAIGVTILRQDIEILQEMHIFCRAGRIIKWISFLTHSDVKVFDKNSELCLLELAQQLKSHDLIDVQLNAEFQIIDGTDSSCDDTSDDEEGMTVTQKATAKFGNFAKGMLKKALS